MNHTKTMFALLLLAVVINIAAFEAGPINLAMSKLILTVCIVATFSVSPQTLRRRLVATAMIAEIVVLAADGHTALLISGTMILAYMAVAFKDAEASRGIDPLLRGALICLVIDILLSINTSLWSGLDTVYTMIFSTILSIVGKRVEVSSFSHSMLVAACVLAVLIGRTKLFMLVIMLFLIVLFHAVVVVLLTTASASASPFALSYSNTILTTIYLGTLYYSIRPSGFVCKAHEQSVGTAPADA